MNRINWVESILKQKLIIYLLALVICIAGLFSLFTITIAPFPAVNINKIYITITYPGANAETVNKQVTSEVIQGLQTINNIQSIIANTQSGLTQIILSLNDVSRQALLQAQIDIMQAIQSAHLPTSVSQPEIQVARGQSGLIEYMVMSKKHSLFEVTNFINATIKPFFSSLPGVVLYTANLNPAVKISLNPVMLAKYRLNPLAIAQLIDSNYQSAPLGSLYVASEQYILNASDNLNTLNSLKHLVIGYEGGDANATFGQPIQLSDIASISFAPQLSAITPYASVDGQLASYVNLNTQTNANPFKIKEATASYINKLQHQVGNEYHIKEVFNMASIMQTAMDEVVFTIIIACMLVIIVALLFLGRFKTTLIPIATIPVCLLGAVVVIHLLGLSLNIIVLLAMVISVGLVVDDAIVVVENITTLLERGMPKYQAVIEGTATIAMTVIGITLTLVAVYLPLVFIDSLVIQVIKPFALTLAASVLISGIIALTLTPVMAITFTSDKAPNQYQLWFEKVLARIILIYHNSLNFVLTFPKTMILSLVVLLALSIYIVSFLPKMVFPADPSGTIKVTVNANPTDTVATIRQKLALFEPFYHKKTLKDYIIHIDQDPDSGKLTGTLLLSYKDKYIKENSQFLDEINSFIKKKKINNTFARINSFSNWSNTDLEVYLYGGSNQKKVDSIAKEITNKLKDSSLFATVNNSISSYKKQFDFNIDSAKSEQVGISREDIINLLSTYYGGYILNNNFSIVGLSVPIVVKLGDHNLLDPGSFSLLTITSKTTGKSYPLSAFVSLKLVAKPTSVMSFNNQATVDIKANLNQGKTLSEAISTVNQLINNYGGEVQYQYVGNAKDYLSGNNQTILIVLFGLLCIYVLLTLVFGNLVDPFIILLTVPFSVIGGALSLYLINGSFNIYSILGLITLVGLITKHGVLIIQFANNELKNAKPLKEAILLATEHRFRPIMMTTLAMIFGALPLLLSSNIMYVSRQNLAIVIMGGLIIGTLFSLFIVPLMYEVIKGAKLRLTK
ncbi:efflux RND transporter permease subunit [Thiotrichales bacterium 19X7-9]|nr:efflux RND transporter permease subunit [Thiotrichales bacterium 19X7-9]